MQHAIEKDDGVKATKHFDGTHHKDGAVDAGNGNEQLVDEIRHKHEYGEQGMPVDIVLRPIPARHNRIAPRIEARDMEDIAGKRVIIVSKWRKLVVVLGNDQPIERQHHQQGSQSQPPLFGFQSKNSQHNI